jgi:HPt (histidine-containing phosphotransfer) domain-containing protein
MISPEAIKKYVQRRHEDLAACKQALTARDFPIIENVGHKMKGNGLTFGYPELAEIGKDMESSAVAKDIELVTNQVNAFEKWCETQKNLDADQPQPEASL